MNLQKILEDHKVWLESIVGQGKRANLSHADLRGVNLGHADLRYANLDYANLSQANLCYADLTHANLSQANLKGADLREADLKRADLRGANLCYADLNGADLTDANIDFSCWPLWCGSLKVKVDERQKRQLLYHLLSIAPEYCTPKLVSEANKFHRWECNRLEIT